MNLGILDWCIMFMALGVSVILALSTKKYSKGVADFLVAGRSAGRYLICIADGMAGLGAVSIVWMCEQYSTTGFSLIWWTFMTLPVGAIVTLSGWVSYRLRETRCLTMAQFFEVRYSKKIRIFAGVLAWVAGVINMGIFPAVGARFFIYFCGLPPTVPFLGISTFATLMAILLLIALFFVFVGGQVTVVVTDFFQGTFTNIVLIVVLITFIYMFDWEAIVGALKMSTPAGKSMLNPFDSSGIKDMNFFMVLISIIGGVYGYMTFQGQLAYNASASSAHESKMARILGEWRGLLVMALVVALPLAAKVVMSNPEYAPIAQDVSQSLAGCEDANVQRSMVVPVVLSKILPTGVLGLFGAFMLVAFISTHDTYLHSWGSIFLQDVILPVRKKQISPRKHILLLRMSILLVALIIFLFSLFFQLTEHIILFLTITGAIFTGGAGSLVIGGLYWKRGTISGAWAALILGGSIPVVSMIFRQYWASDIYPWMVSNAPDFLNGLKYILERISDAVPGINWYVGPDEFPIGSAWMMFFTILIAISSYVICSLFEAFVLQRESFNLERMLHRGKYAIKDDLAEKSKVKCASGLKTLLPGKEFSKSDKLIYWGKIIWAMGWFTVFIIGTVWALNTDTLSEDSWSKFWWWWLFIYATFGALLTVWFICGGLKNLREMFVSLNTKPRDDRDDGTVLAHHNLADEPVPNEADKT